MKLTASLSALLAVGVQQSFASLQGLRNVVYFDQYHTTTLPPKDVTAGITHVIMAFASSSLFIGNTSGPYTPFMPVNDVRAMFDANVKVGIAIGGWGDTAGFSAGAKTDASRLEFALKVAAMANNNTFDFVDVDWEFPGGNGADYKQIPNSQKTDEIESFPKLLSAIKTALGDKLLSVAVPANENDMIAYTPEQAPKIFEAVQMVNLMSYDMMTRRSTTTLHHTDVRGSLAAVDRYISLGLDPAKLNLGIAFYAKYFETPANSTCDTYPIGCPIVKAENDDGSDAGTSAAVTFETVTTPTNLTTSTDGSCGKGTFFTCKDDAGNECCSQYGYCGSTAAHCGAGCQADYSVGCTGIQPQVSFAKALKEGKYDVERGGAWYHDAEQHLFWTWDTAVIITRKFHDIIAARRLGGVMAWSLAEDSADWSHIKAIQQGVKDADASSSPRVRRKARREI
jgi:chitinase